MRELDQNFVDKGEQVNSRELLACAIRYWYLFVLGLALFLGIAFVYLRYTVPVYNISSKLLIKDDKKGSDLNGNAVFSELESFSSTSNMDNAVEVLKSESLMQRALKDLSLQISYYKQGQFVDQELYEEELLLKVIPHDLNVTELNKAITIRPKDKKSFWLEDHRGDSVKLSSHKYGNKVKKSFGTFKVVKGKGLKNDPDYQDWALVVKFHNIEKLAAHYSKKVTIEPASKSASVIVLSISDPVPQKGKDIINKLVELYNYEGLQDKNHIATTTLAFLDERLESLIEELTNVEKNVEEYKQQKAIADVNSQAKSYVESDSENKKKLDDWSIQINMLESIEAYLQKQGNNFELVPSTLGIKDLTLTDLINRFNELQLERERMLRTTKLNNPLVQDINEQLTILRANILENLKNIKHGLIITQNNLQANSSQYSSKIKEVPSIERHLLEISRQQGIKQGLYLYLLQKREESALALSASVSNIRVIDPAIAGNEPASPRTSLILLLAFVLGLGFPFGFVYVKTIFNDKVRERKNVTELSTTPILGEIPHNTTNDVIVVSEKSRLPIADYFRLIRINLNFSSVDRENKVILVTSSMSGEGKTFFSINLAASLALSGKKVVLLDMDLRKSSIMEDLNMPNNIGITNYVKSEVTSIGEVVRPIEAVPLLYVIGTGPLPPNPAEFTMNARIGQLIHELKQSFDHVILDTAPVGQVPDAFLLAPFLDTTLYIARYNFTFKSQIQIINDIHKQNKMKNPMIVLNDAKKENGNSYGYGYGYGYGERKIRKREKKNQIQA